MFHISSKPRPAHPRKAYDCILLGRWVIFQCYFDGSLRTDIFKFIVLNISFFMKDLGNFLLYIRGGNLNYTVGSFDCIPQPGQVISYWIGHIIIVLPALPFSGVQSYTMIL